MHNGVYRGELSHVIEVVNKITGLMELRDRAIYMKKKKMDILLHEQNAEKNWVKEAIKTCDFFFIIDNGHFNVARYTVELCKRNNIPYMKVDI